MTAAADPTSTSTTVPSIALELPDAFTAIASPEVQALATEWIASSQAYFRALESWGRTSNAPPSREQVETVCDLAIMEDEAVRRRIIDLRPTERGALALKATAFLVHMPDLDQVDMIVADAVGDEGPSAEAFAFTLARDMVGVFGPIVQALAELAKPERRP